ncbi:MAG: hypothetical protein GTN70_08845 [Deltaproteobacteria bacterium]|nr:hypothetical protein [Deltaproteobacteria bacterium]NIS77882.1 hypothetical protein [Deltaproteobacteria bacterium]
MNTNESSEKRSIAGDCRHSRKRYPARQIGLDAAEYFRRRKPFEVFQKAVCNLIVLLLLVTTADGVRAAQIGSPKEAQKDCAVPIPLRTKRPGAGGEPTKVHVGFVAIDLTDIDDATQTFNVDFHILIRWVDPRLSAEMLGHSLEGCRIGLHDIWNPEFRMVNKREAIKHFEDTVSVDPAGTVTYRQRVLGRFSARLNLRDFPRDTQELSVQIASTLDPGEVVFVPDTKLTGKLQDFSISGWEVGPGEPETGIIDVPLIERKFPSYTYRFHATRHVGYYLWTIIFPLGLIVFMGWTVFWIDPVHLGPQLGTATAAIFTLIAFRLAIGRLLPAVEYLTRLDKFIVGSSVLMFAALGEAILTCSLAARGNHLLSTRIDRWARPIYVLTFTAVVVYSFFI